MPVMQKRETFHRAFTNASRETVDLIYYHGEVTYRCTEISTILRARHLTSGVIHLRDLPTLYDCCLDPAYRMLVIPFCRSGYQRSNLAHFQLSVVTRAYLHLDHPRSIREWLRDTIGNYIQYVKVYQRRHPQTSLLPVT